MIRRYRKILKEVEAAKVSPDSIREIADWLGDDCQPILDGEGEALFIVQRVMRTTAHMTDWVVKRDDGTIGVFTEDSFLSIYEEVE